MGISKILCKLLRRGMWKNFKLSRKFNKKFRGERNGVTRCLPGRCFFTRTDDHCASDQEICLPTARDVLQPIYVSEITRNFPSEILMPFASARHELGEINLLVNRDNCCAGNSQLSLECEENVAEIFAWVYNMDIREDNFPDVSDRPVCGN